MIELEGTKLFDRCLSYYYSSSHIFIYIVQCSLPLSRIYYTSTIPSPNATPSTQQTFFLVPAAMAGPAYFIAALAICFSMAAAVASASNTPGHNPCSFAELPIQYCKSFLQKGIHCSKPSLACCALVSDIFMVNPSCLCEVMKPSFLGVAADPARVSLLPELCHLPTKNLHCFGTSFACCLCLFAWVT